MVIVEKPPKELGHKQELLSTQESFRNQAGSNFPGNRQRDVCAVNLLSLNCSVGNSEDTSAHTDGRENAETALVRRAATRPPRTMG